MTDGGHTIRRLTLGALLIPLFFILLSISVAPAESAGEKILSFRLSGVITGAHADALADALFIAESNNYSALLMIISTPGGSVDAMINIISHIDNSPVPVIAYVYPAGSTAWSAGTYILMASHLAAMAPNTVIGSCQPVSYSPLGSEPINDSKTINALVSVMETHAVSRGRNATLARLFVTENLNADDSEALQYGVIEFRGESLDSLLTQVNGMSVNTSAGPVTLNSEGAELVDYNYRLRETLINAVSDPTVASILFLVGLFALLFGIQSPGVGGEVLGGVAILFALIGLGFNVNLVSVVMVIIGAIMLIYELATPGFGILGISGVILMTIGALFIVPFGPENWAISADWYSIFVIWVAVASICVAAFFIFAIIKVVQIRMKRPIIGSIVGDVVIATEDAPPNSPSYVIYQGEQWQAKCETGLRSGKKYQVVAKEDYMLILKETGQ